jgi:hypothetical protein
MDWILANPVWAVLLLALLFSAGFVLMALQKSAGQRKAAQAKALQEKARAQEIAREQARQKQQKRSGDQAGDAMRAVGAPAHMLLPEKIDLDKPIDFAPVPAAERGDSAKSTKLGVTISAESINDSLPALDFIASPEVQKPVLAKSSAASASTAAGGSAKAAAPATKAQPGKAAAASTTPASAKPVAKPALAAKPAVEPASSTEAEVPQRFDANPISQFEKVSFVDDLLALDDSGAEALPELRRIVVAKKNDLRVMRVVLDSAEGEILQHFELYRADALVFQGTQAQVQAEAKRLTT